MQMRLNSQVGVSPKLGRWRWEEGVGEGLVKWAKGEILSRVP